MYSRSYYPETGEKLTIPENYDGTAFMKKETQQEEEACEVSFIESEPSHSERENTPKSITAGIDRIPFFSGLFGNGGLNLKLPKIGTEEILIIATAAFLFFSKDGDKESALILLLLLLIN